MSIIKSAMRTAAAIFRNSLYRNSFYLLMSSVLNAASGFVFWVIAARLYSSDQVGIGSALTSALTLLGFIGTLGLGMGIIRFLPELKDKRTLLNSSFSVALVVSLAVALIFAAGTPVWSPKLLSLRTDALKMAGFACFVIASSFGTLAISVFIGFRKAHYAVFYTLVTLADLPLVFIFSHTGSAYGILAAWGISETIAACFVFLYCFPRLLQDYSPVPRIRMGLLKSMVSFTFVNFIGELLRMLPGMLLPLIVVDILGASENAYFYVSWTMAGVALLVPMMTSLTLLAEGSEAGTRLGTHIRRSLKMNLFILVPVLAVLCIFGDKILLIMGRQYSSAGGKLLWLLAPAAIPAAINMLYVSILRVEKKLGLIMLVTGTVAAITLALSWVLIPRMGLTGVGVGWLSGQAGVAAVTGVRLVQRMKSEAPVLAPDATGQAPDSKPE